MAILVSADVVDIVEDIDITVREGDRK